MPESSFLPLLQDLGLSENEAKMYELLLSSGTTKARDLVEKSGLGRGHVYNVLTQLQQKGLALAIQGKQIQFQAVDPSKLQGLLEAKKQAARRLESAFLETLPKLSSAFNLSTGKPAIQIFEGLDGFEQALNDSLESKTEILTYIDVKAVSGATRAINDRYVKRRVAKNISKRILLIDTPEMRRFFAELKIPNTTCGFLKGFPATFGTGLEIYDGTVAYVTLQPDKMISLVIKDKNIYELHRLQFEYLWKQASVVTFLETNQAAARDRSEAAGSKTT